MVSPDPNLFIIYLFIYLFSLSPGRPEKIKVLTFCLIDNSTC